MSSLPTRTDISGSPSKATAQAAFSALFDFVAQRLATGTAGAGTASSAELQSARDSLGMSGYGGRNVLINGNFAINQRAYVTGAAVGAGLYGHDRWKMAASGDTYTFSTTANVTTVTIPAGKVLRQVVEGLNLLTGTYTLSWSGTAQAKIGGGSYGASGVTGAITGGTDTTIEFGPGTVSKAQLEFGPVATAFEQRSYGLELLLCKRYLPAFKAISAVDQICTGWCSTTTSQGLAFFDFEIAPRVPPTGMTISAVAHFQVYNPASASSVCSAIAFINSSTRRATFSWNASAIYLINTPTVFNAANTSAQILFTGCEL